MAFSDFTLDSVRRKLGVTTALTPLFPNLQPVPPPQWLLDGFSRNTPLSLASEQARRESLIAPLLSAARFVSGDKLAIFSAQAFDVDASRGLNGECDYLVACAPAVPPVRSPLVAVVEAKKADIDAGLGQCVAEMVAAREFNQDDGEPDAPVYGCVTNGELWQWLKLDGNRALIDPHRQQLTEVGSILAAFLAVLAEYEAAVARRPKP
jgi:hypothetical protein